MTRWKSILLVLLLGSLVPGVSPGRVFRSAGVRGGQLNTAGLPWEFAYHTTMSVNGRRNAVYVYSARFHEPVEEQLKSQFERQGATVVLHRTPDGATGLAKWPDREARILVLSPDSQPNQMVFLFYPEALRSGETHFPIPEYPGAKMGSTTLDEETKTFCATLETTDSIEQIHTFYAGVLAANGWSPALPWNRSGEALSRMALFHKHEKMCCILATNKPDGFRRVTVLVKGGGL